MLIEFTTETVDIVEIVDDEQLLLAYGMRIPVLLRNDTKAELSWPFNSADIALFLA